MGNSTLPVAVSTSKCLAQLGRRFDFLVRYEGVDSHCYRYTATLEAKRDIVLRD